MARKIIYSTLTILILFLVFCYCTNSLNDSWPLFHEIKVHVNFNKDGYLESVYSYYEKDGEEVLHGEKIEYDSPGGMYGYDKKTFKHGEQVSSTIVLISAHDEME